ncbi:MAG: DUF6778 family protein [Paracoccaceae bacterium]
MLLALTITIFSLRHDVFLANWQPVPLRFRVFDADFPVIMAFDCFQFKSIHENSAVFSFFRLIRRSFFKHKTSSSCNPEIVLKPIKIIVALIALVVLSACSSGGFGGAAKMQGASVVDVSQLPSMRVVGVNISVPRSLKVSEENSIKPKADIVWHGDPYGDRYAQVHKVMEDGIGKGVAGIQGNLPVVVTIEMTRFHALTPRTRYGIGGVHEINFNMMVTNSRTGDVIIPWYPVDASFKGYKGDQAVEAENRGLTQKVRIENQLAAIIRQELTGVPAVLQE